MATRHMPQTCYLISCKSKSHDQPEYSLFVKRENVKGK